MAAAAAAIKYERWRKKQQTIRIKHHFC